MRYQYNGIDMDITSKQVIEEIDGIEYELTEMQMVPSFNGTYPDLVLTFQFNDDWFWTDENKDLVEESILRLFYTQFMADVFDVLAETPREMWARTKE